MTRKYPSGAQRRKTKATDPKKARQGLSRCRIKDQYGLIPAHRKLLEAYVTDADFDLLKACDIVGLHPSHNKSARLKQAERVLARPEVRAFMQQWIESDPMVMARHERLRGLSRIARGDFVDIVVDADGVEHKRPPKMEHRLKAYEMLGKAQGDAINVNVQINPEQMSEAEIVAAMVALGVDISQLGHSVIDTDGEDIGRDDTGVSTLDFDEEAIACPDLPADP